jgi:hypothetical protein
MSASSLLLLLLLAVGFPGAARAQEPTDAARDEARRLLAEAEAHEDAGRHALAAERYLDMYDVMRGAGMERAPIALFSAGRTLAQVPGREAEARDTLRRFMSESTTLTEDPQVRDWRSGAASLIDELEARTAAAQEGDGTSPELGEPGVRSGPAEGSGAGQISPVGPVVLGLGGAVLIPGLIIIGVAYSQDQNLIARCPARVECDAAMRSEVPDTRSLGLVGDVLWIAGAGVAILGLVLTFVLEEGGGEQAEVRLQGTPGGGLVSLRWRYQ